MPLCVILSKKTPLRGCFRVELSKIHNKLRIFESQNAASVLRIYKEGQEHPPEIPPCGAATQFDSAAAMPQLRSG